jgi:hypothetical protein
MQGKLSHGHPFYVHAGTVGKDVGRHQANEAVRICTVYARAPAAHLIQKTASHSALHPQHFIYRLPMGIWMVTDTVAEVRCVGGIAKSERWII